MVQLSYATTASPKPSFRAPWRVDDAVVGRGNAGWTTKNGHPCRCQNYLQGPPAKKTGRGSLLDHPSSPFNNPISQGTELNWIKMMIVVTPKKGLESRQWDNTQEHERREKRTACTKSQTSVTSLVPEPHCTTISSSVFEVEISLHTLNPVFRPGLVHSSSAGWDDCGWLFPEKLCLGLFLDRFPTLPHSNFVESRVYALPALLAEWPGTFMCHCSDTGWNGHWIRVCTQS